MQRETAIEPNPEDGFLTRRTVLGGLMTAVVTSALLETAADGPALAGAAPVPPKTAVAMPRAFHTVTVLQDGRLLFAGGVSSGNRALSNVQIYDAHMDTWINVAAMSSGRFQHAATLLANGRVLVTGGLEGASRPLSSGEIYNPYTDIWSPAPAMAMPRYGHTLSSLVNGAVVVMGGCSPSPLSRVEFYSPVVR